MVKSPNVVNKHQNTFIWEMLFQLSPMMRREWFSPRAEGSVGSYVVHLSLSHDMIYM
jgi:hypothetical protein